MSENTTIGWTGATWNPWIGCRKVSAGCGNCFWFRDAKRYGHDPMNVHRTSTRTFQMPLKLEAGKKVFTCSWSDFFIEEADAWRAEAWEMIKWRSDLTFQILTKRPERIASCLPSDWGNGYPNVWLVVSCEHQEAADKRIPILLKVPAVVRGVSAGPLIGGITFRWMHYFHESTGETYRQYLERTGSIGEMESLVGIDWVAIECESGPSPRGWSTYEDNARLLIEQCKSAGVAAFHKQMPINGRVSTDMNEWPADLRVRQWPKGDRQ